MLESVMASDGYLWHMAIYGTTGELEPLWPLGIMEIFMTKLNNF